MDQAIPKFDFSFRDWDGRQGVGATGQDDGCCKSSVDLSLTCQRVDQFFSARVTHLIVKSTTAKPMAPPPRKHAISESPKNPFLDGTGVTDLAQKAKAMNIKVWPLDSAFERRPKLTSRIIHHLDTSCACNGNSERVSAHSSRRRADTRNQGARPFGTSTRLLLL